MIESSRRTLMTTRNDNLLARARLWDRHAYDMDLGRFAVLAWLVTRRGCCGNLVDDLDLTVADDDPLDGISHNRPGFGAPCSRGHIIHQLGSGQLPSEDSEHQYLDSVRPATAMRARIFPAATYQG